MKNCIYILLFVTILVSCKQRDKQQNVADTAKTTIRISKIKYQNPLFAQYANYLKQKDDKVPGNATDAAKKFFELFKGTDTATCDTAFLIFDKFYKKMAEALEDANEKDDIDLEKYFGYVKRPKNVPSKVSAYLEALNSNGFRIDESEGEIYVTQDWDFVEKNFSNLVSNSMRDFIAELNIENKKSYLEDGSLDIGADTLVDRAVWWERFEKNHTNFIWKDEVSSTRKEYLNVLLEGSDNTEIMIDNKLNDYFKQAYSYVQSKYPDTETYKLAKPVYELLLQGKKPEADKLILQYHKRGLLFN